MDNDRSWETQQWKLGWETQQWKLGGKPNCQTGALSTVKTFMFFRASCQQNTKKSWIIHLLLYCMWY
jgi:hypothetical protein